MERMAKMAQQFTEQYEVVDFLLANYFGYHPNLKKILLERMEQASMRLNRNADLENFRKYAESMGMNTIIINYEFSAGALIFASVLIFYNN